MSLSMLPGNSNEETETPLISRRALFGNPDRALLRVSPDGMYLGFLAPTKGVLNIWVASTKDPHSAKVVTSETTRGIRHYEWAYAPHYLLYLQDKDGDENWQIHSLNIETLVDLNLTPSEEILNSHGVPLTDASGKRVRPTARIQQKSAHVPDEILIGLNQRHAAYHDIFRANIQTGGLQIIQRNDSFLRFITDDHFQIRFGERMTADGGKDLFQPLGKGNWKKYMHIPMEDSLTTRPLEFDETGDDLFMLDSRGRDTVALVRLNLKQGSTKVLAEDLKADVSDVMIHPVTKTIQAVAVNYVREEWQILDQTIQQDMDYLRNFGDGDIRVTDRSQDDRYWTVTYIEDSQSTRYYHYDRTAQTTIFLFTNRQAIENMTLAKTHPILISARDGLTLVSYLTLPVWTNPTGGFIPLTPLPMVLYVHGGPWARDSWAFDHRSQWLANRGYAVLRVNFRGSIGFGKTFVNAANREWAGKMHDDLVDAVGWAIEQGIADRQRVGIMGGSYGGFAALVGLTFTPELFACGIDLVGPSNLQTVLETIPPYQQPMKEQYATRIGDPSTADGREFLKSRSPLNKACDIIRPLLIGHGANDPRVKQSESDQIVDLMLKQEIPVTYVVYPDEGHNFARPENRLSLFSIVEIFLEEHLGGRSEAIGDDFENSSIEVKAGAHLISGLSDSIH